jgi:hypothetical protein
MMSLWPVMYTANPPNSSCIQLPGSPAPLPSYRAAETYVCSSSSMGQHESWHNSFAHAKCKLWVCCSRRRVTHLHHEPLPTP